jgi:hypothetical protein
MVIKMKNSCKLIRKNSYEVHKHQDRYQEILESLYDDLDINPVPSESRLRQPTPTCEYKAVPEFLALRLKKAIDKAKDSIFAIFYDVPLQIDMSAFRRNVAVAFSPNSVTAPAAGGLDLRDNIGDRPVVTLLQGGQFDHGHQCPAFGLQPRLKRVPNGLTQRIPVLLPTDPQAADPRVKPAPRILHNKGVQREETELAGRGPGARQPDRGGVHQKDLLLCCQTVLTLRGVETRTGDL